MERQELHNAIDTLPDDAITHLIPYIMFLRLEYKTRESAAELTGIAATRAAVAELRAGKGNRAHSIEELMAALHDDEND
jgi:hypothetical protein